MRNFNVVQIFKFKKHNSIFIIKHLTVLILFSVLYKYIAENYGSSKDKDNFRNYNNSLYFTCATQFGIGYGDITPESIILKRVCMFHLILVFILIVV